MTNEQAMKIANRVLTGFGFPLAEPPKLGFDTWQVFSSRDGETISAFMDNGLDLNGSAEQLEVAIRSELPFPPLPTAPPMSKRYPQSVIGQILSPCFQVWWSRRFNGCPEWKIPMLRRLRRF
jgi:hypothetical protein